MVTTDRSYVHAKGQSEISQNKDIDIKTIFPNLGISGL